MNHLCRLQGTVPRETSSVMAMLAAAAAKCVRAAHPTKEYVTPQFFKRRAEKPSNGEGSPWET